MFNVVICGLGAIGTTYAKKFLHKNICLKILANKERIDKFKTQPPMLNGTILNLEYITPEDTFCADLILITTKAQGLNSVLQYIKNCIKDNTRILSLINGISSEEIIQKEYPNTKVLKSYFIGHSAVRTNNNVTQDGIGTIFLEHDKYTEHILNQVGIDYTVPEDIDYSMWLKYTFNIFSNQISAILNMTFGELKNNKEFLKFARKIINEVQQIAIKKGIKNTQNLEKDSLNALSKMCDEGKTSMLQDVLAKRQTEVEIFSGEIIKLGEKYGIETPYNQALYNLVKIKESQYEYSIHTR